MKKYIVSRPPYEGFNYAGKSLGIMAKSFICINYANPGKHYRHPEPTEDSGLTILEFTTREMAQVECDRVNALFNDSFEVEEIEKEVES